MFANLQLTTLYHSFQGISHHSVISSGNRVNEAILNEINRKSLSCCYCYSHLQCCQLLWLFYGQKMTLFDKMRKSEYQFTELVLGVKIRKVGNTDVEEVDRHGNGEIFCLSPNFVIFYVTHLTDYSREKGMDLFTMV